MVNFSTILTNGGANPAYQWKKNGTDIAGATNSSYSTNTLVDGDIISCEMTSDANCAIPAIVEDPVNMTITPIAVPDVSIVADNNPTCSGGTVIFTATPLNGGSDPVYQWQKNGSNVGIDSSSYSDNTPVADDEITCMLTSNELCAQPATVTSDRITIAIKAGLAISISPQGPLCAGYSWTLVPDSGYVSYLWMDGTTSQSYPASATGLYSVIVTDQFGCKGADSVNVILCPDAFAIPSAFSPNGDGLNDVFRVLWNADVSPTSFSMLIYNQWGRLVYEGHNILIGWDGQINGELCPTGVYTYVISIEKPAGKSPAQQTTTRGLVTLVR